MIYCNGCRWLETNLVAKTFRCLNFGTINPLEYEGNRIIPCDTCKGAYREPEKTKKEAVNHPAHYQGKIEVIDIMDSIVTSMDLTPWEAVLTAQVVRYIGRWKNKGGVEDLKKAEWYLKKLIEEVGK